MIVLFIDALIGRWLKALFAMSNETVDDIRCLDPRNRKHFDLFPSDLADKWVNGVIMNAGVESHGSPERSLLKENIDGKTSDLLSGRLSALISRDNSNEDRHKPASGVFPFKIPKVLRNLDPNGPKPGVTIDRTTIEYLPGK